ncbi:endonuclease/exonuclease/phosphatase family protein [Mumia flava]|uniref:Endonuclease/exonuclease/phosphatase family protein n=1 Tax=Mumia flava TaxID=1348852 RepID=A0A0B2BMZ3_9ACTN|nr:endonuclease/exonuclease/phosphatase family protein [Mumia flava]PJJ58509.1 endonuclease/exonuclease/phosphatase family protein [Mumia flava]
MRRTTVTATLAAAGLVATAALSSTAAYAGQGRPGDHHRGGKGHGHGGHGHTKDPVRFATFNASLNRATEGALGAELASPGSAQPAAVAQIIQTTRPDVLLLNEFDYDPQALADFQENYLEVGQDGQRPITYRYSFIAPSNTGVPSGFDYNNNGVVGGGDDAHGFGLFPGQYGMAVLSRYPIDTESVRTFQLFRWKDMPGALLPDDPSTPEPADWYSPGPELDSFRLSSKSHWDVPVRIGRETVHLLASHPTPPTFDDPAVDWNGRRNHDEIRFWADYVGPGKKAGAYIYDDDGVYGGLKPGERFVIAGDQNSDPFDGDSIDGSAQQLLDHPLVDSRATPSSEGGVEQAALQGGANADHVGDPAYDTADFADGAPGNLRADYVLPRKGMRVLDAGVHWPLSSDPAFLPVGTFPFPSSDHRLVWIDVASPRR